MRVRGVEGIPEVEPHHSIPTLLEELDPPDPDTVVVVASTIVSKAEDRGRRLSAFDPSDRARSIADRLSRLSDERKDPRFAQAVIEESEEILMEAPFLLTVTRFGHIGVNAGIDRSNLPNGADILLLPRDPTTSAERIRRGLSTAPPVIVSDTCGRPFRRGQRGVAIGWAGIPATRDWRGMPDRRGRRLDVTVEAVVDELAAAANLVSGEAADGFPVVYIEGWLPATLDGGNELFREPTTDYIRHALRKWTFDPPASG